MQVNHEKKLIFIHIPKCAGCSVKRYFNMKTEVDNHESAFMAKKRCEYWNEYTKFTVVRNPWEAELSFFFHRLSKQFITTLKKELAELQKDGSQDQTHLSIQSKAHIKMAVGGFGSSLKMGGIQAWDWLKKNRPSGNLYPFSMMRYITSNQGDNLLNEIIRFENLQSDLDNFCNKYNIEPANQLQKTNTTAHLHYSNYYTEPMIDYVYKKNKDYIKYFGYEFEKDEELNVK